MKRFILLIIGTLFISVTYSQSSFHNYFSQTTGDYVQIGYGQRHILFRYPLPNNQFVRLDYLTTKGGMNYYGGNKLQVVIAENAEEQADCQTKDLWESEASWYYMWTPFRYSMARETSFVQPFAPEYFESSCNKC